MSQSPSSRRLVMFLLVSFEQISNRRLKRVLGIRIVHERTDTKQYLRNSQSRTPLILKNIQADVPRAADIAVIDLGHEVTIGGLNG